MSRKTVNEQATRKGVFVQVSVVVDTDRANPHEIRDAIRAASAKTLDRFNPPRAKHHEHVHFAVRGQMPLPYPSE